MANVQKYTASATGHLAAHYERRKDENGEYIKFGNQDINTSKSHENYNLAPDRGTRQIDYIQNRLNEVHVLKRKDVNVMCSWVITAPKELPPEHQKEFFERSYNFLKNRYDPEEKNVISAYVHMDETTPHMHYAFVPVKYDEKKNREKVSAKDVLTKNELQKFHGDLQAEMDIFVEGHNHTFECYITNGATAGGNKAIQEFKAEILESLNDDLALNLDEKQVELDIISGQIKDLEKDCTELVNKVDDLNEQLPSLYKTREHLKAECDILRVTHDQWLQDGANKAGGMSEMKKLIEKTKQERLKDVIIKQYNELVNFLKKQFPNVWEIYQKNIQQSNKKDKNIGIE